MARSRKEDTKTKSGTFADDPRLVQEHPISRQECCWSTCGTKALR